MSQSTQRQGGAVMLGFDTATADAAVAIAEAGELIAERRIEPVDGRPRHAECLLAGAGELVEDAGGWEAVGSVAVGIGPGMFTGLRIGVTAARALAQARSLELRAVGSLAALARGIGDSAPRATRRLALIDARRNEVFAALYDEHGAVVWEPFVCGLDELAERLSGVAEDVVAGGDGSLRFRAELEAAEAAVLDDRDPAHRMSARHICALAEEAEPVEIEQATPLYLRRPDAEVWREQRKHGKHGQ